MEITKKQETFLLIIWTQSLLAVFGSLFYSEVMGYIPCDLCWYQRILMYPLVVIYGVALIRKDINVAFPGVILSGIGILVSVYHYSLQKVPFLQDVGCICGDVPCTSQYINYFGFVTIPFLALIAFTVIFVCHLIMVKKVTS